MKNIEIVPYSKYEVTEKTPSQYIVGEHYDKVIGTLCPACGEMNVPLRHGGGCACKCGLNMLLHGNALQIWK